MAMNTPFAPVTRRTISSEIRAQLLEAIRTGELQPGSPVPAERLLCEQFGVARTSVREAIQGLRRRATSSAAATARWSPSACPRSASPATSATLDDRKALVRQLFEVRRDRAGDVGARGTPGDRRTSAPTSPQLAARSTTQLDEFRAIDSAFHTAISRACGNPLLQEVHGKTLGALFDSGELASLLYAEVNRREVAEIIASSTAAHRAIADAVVARTAQGHDRRGGGPPRRRRAPHDRAAAVSERSRR